MTRGKKKRGGIEPFLSRKSDWLLVWNVDGCAGGERRSFRCLVLSILDLLFLSLSC